MFEEVRACVQRLLLCTALDVHVCLDLCTLACILYVCCVPIVSGLLFLVVMIK